ncbi:hypothetical protein AGMMS49525_10580 [Bacteroidia bacterium]|nr:hypothetical protein AGMMS49525_10580 [Bacteroidia bacterium]
MGGGIFNQIIHLFKNKHYLCRPKEVNFEYTDESKLFVHGTRQIENSSLPTEMVYFWY